MTQMLDGASGQTVDEAMGPNEVLSDHCAALTQVLADRRLTLLVPWVHLSGNIVHFYLSVDALS